MAPTRTDTIKKKTRNTVGVESRAIRLGSEGGAGGLASLTVPIAEAKKGLSELCARAAYARETIVVTKHGRPVAAIIGIEDLERSAALEDRYAVELLERAVATSPGTAKVKLRA